jgi:hypothetical protein
MKQWFIIENENEYKNAVNRYEEIREHKKEQKIIKKNFF